MRAWTRLLTAASVFALLLSGCQEGQQPAPTPTTQPTPTPPGPPPPQPTSPSQAPKTTPAQPQAGGSKDVHLNLAGSDPVMPLRGTIRAYQIKDASQLMPGLLADGFIGDLELENDLMRAVIGRPGKQLAGVDFGGLLVDLACQKNPVDYINSLQVLSDVDSTHTVIVFDKADPPFVNAATTATARVHGYVAEHHEDEPATAAPHRIEGLEVTTTYELPKNEHYLLVTTRFTNNTSAPITLSPGDVTDWGTAGVFVEGVGLLPPGQAISPPVRWTAAFADDFSAGYITSGPQMMNGVYSSRHTIVRSVGTGAVAASEVGAAPARGQRKASQTPEAGPRMGPPAGATPTPHIIPFPGPNESWKPPVTLPPGAETMSVPAPGFRPIQVPAPETSLAPAPAPETRLAPPPAAPETLHAPSLPSPEQPQTTGSSPAKGGGGENRDSQTTAAQSDPATTAAAPRSQETTASATRAAVTDPNRVILQPGESYEFVRYIVVSDADFSRVARLAHEIKNVTTATIGGIVLEQGTDAPIANAEVRVSGGANWDGRSQPPAYTRALTRADGTFSVHVPLGKYVVVPAKTARQRVGNPQIVSATNPASPQLLPLTLSRETILRVGVSEAETATSTPLPCKVTFQPKPDSPPLNWGFGPDITRGVRNVFYMPRGGAEIPITPGRYQMTISRGIEYDIVQQDITVAPGPVQEILVSLPHVVHTPGMISIDPGVMTKASAVSNISPSDRVRMAACEGVSVLISGDYDTATDLQAEIQAQGLDHRLRAFLGMRLLVAKDNMAADLLVYPLTPQTANELKQFRAGEGADTPPDVFIADLHKKFPQLIIEIDRPADPERGYLSAFAFNSETNRFEQGAMPPADFEAMQLVEGSKIGMHNHTAPRYYDMLVARTTAPGAALPLAPMGGSSSRLPYGEEVGYPRTYIYTNHDTIDRLTPEDITSAIRGQHLVVTNGPIPLLSVREPKTPNFKLPGDVVDMATTAALVVKVNVLAAPWVSLSGVNVNANGLPKAMHELGRATREVQRYPQRKTPNADMEVLYFTEDAILDLVCFSRTRSLAPVVPPNPPDLGGDVMPLAWTGPIYLDQNGDGKITVKR